MNQQKIFRYMLMIFVVLTAVSIVAVVYTYTLPTQKTTTTTTLTYQHVGTYAGRATLKPNIIYNITSIVLGEKKTLYRAILEQIELNFTHSFQSYPEPTNIIIDPALTVELESPGKWIRVLKWDECEELLQLETDGDFNMIINITKLEPIIDIIDEETGIRTASFNLNIKPVFNTRATTPAGVIDETFSPELTVSVIEGGDLGNYLETGELVQIIPGERTETTTVEIEGIAQQRNWANLSALITGSCLVLTLYRAYMDRPKQPPSKRMEKLMSQYTELITETTHKPPETAVTINIATLEDLAKAAEILARPIMHTRQDGEHTFYVIDDDKKYQIIIREDAT